MRTPSAFNLLTLFKGKASTDIELSKGALVKFLSCWGWQDCENHNLDPFDCKTHECVRHLLDVHAVNGVICQCVKSFDTYLREQSLAHIQSFADRDGWYYKWMSQHCKCVSCTFPSKVRKPPCGIDKERISEILDGACEYVGENTKLPPLVAQVAGSQPREVG